MMIKSIFSALTILFAFALQAEETVTFLDKNFEVTSADQAVFERTSDLLDDGHYHVKISFLDGNTRMIGRYSDQTLETEEGWFVYYFATGNRESQGHYHNGERVGTWNRWDWQGNALSDRFYSDYNPTAGETRDAQISDTPNAMQSYIQENLTYPANAEAHHIEGQVRLSFMVDAEGQVQDVEVTYSAHPFLTQAALAFVEAMPAWQPALQNGIPYATKHTLPLTFMLAQPTK